MVSLCCVGLGINPTYFPEHSPEFSPRYYTNWLANRPWVIRLFPQDVAVTEHSQALSSINWENLSYVFAMVTSVLFFLRTKSLFLFLGLKRGLWWERNQDILTLIKGKWSQFLVHLCLIHSKCIKQHYCSCSIW